MIQKLTLWYLVVAFSITTVFSQDNTPNDYLSANFHKNRRAALRDKLPKNSVAVFFANPVRNRSNDVDYVYHQDPDFYYLTGLKEPHSVLVVFSENQTDENGNTYNEIIYVQDKNPTAEMWSGKRLGVEGAKSKLGIANVLKTESFINAPLAYPTFNKVLCHKFKDDYRDLETNNYDLFDLTEAFKKDINFNATAKQSPVKKEVYKLIMATEIENSATVAKQIGAKLNTYPELEEDEYIMDYVDAPDNQIRDAVKEQIINLKAKTQSKKYDTSSLAVFMGELREVKLPEELKLLKKAISISAQAQIEVMKAMKPNMSETEIQGLHEFVYKKYGCEFEGYPSIVGAGNNGCVLHYTANNKTNVENQLVLMDLGAEYHGYTADVTRTIPSSGTFTETQRAIYNIVLDAQNQAIAACLEGEAFWKPGQVASAVINKGLADLGIIESDMEPHEYFPHGTSHYLGLDVHDPGTYNELQENTVITVEPGIYIPEGSPCDKKWWGIAVRIEDDILITKGEPVNLSDAAPRSIEKIEELMKEDSALDDFVLPKID